MKAFIWQFAFFEKAAEMTLMLQNTESQAPMSQPNGDTAVLDEVSTLQKDLVQNSRF